MSDSSLPKVTCFLPTRNRRAWLRAAIANWQLQTYANRELVIVADGEERLNDLIPKDDARITLVHLTPAEQSSLLPEKFNICCRLSQGEILAKWDDDDWYAPTRLEHQVQLLLQSAGAQVAGYRNILFTDGREWYRYVAAPDWIAGTSLLFYRSWWEQHPFRPESPGANVGSDNGFVRAAVKLRQMVHCDAGSMVVAAIHPENTSRKDVRRSSDWRKLKDFPGVPGYRWPLASDEREAAVA